MHFDDEVQRLKFYLKECEEENKKLHEKIERFEKAIKKMKNTWDEIEKARKSS